MPRGGRRAGSPGGSYSNRTDLAQQQNKVPSMVAPGQPYGARKAELDAQKTLPIASSPNVTPMPQAPSPQPAQGGGQGPSSLGQLLSSVGPGLDQDLYRQSERPDEPVTHGADLGPGADSSILPQGQGANNIASILQSAFQATGDSGLGNLAALAARSGN